MGDGETFMRIHALLAVLPLLFTFHSARACDSPGKIQADFSVVENLVRFYAPPLDCRGLAEKETLEEKKRSFMFLRTNVAWYWDRLREDRKCSEKSEGSSLVPKELYATFDRFKGFCAGDAHPENFAVQYYSNGAAPTFGINDPDDAAEKCPVLLDLVRFITATKIAGKKTEKVDTNTLIDTYLKTLTSADAPKFESATVLAQLAKDSGKVHKDFPEDATYCAGKEDEAAFKDFIKSSKIKSNPVPTLKDCVNQTMDHESGGSGGMARYLIRYNTEKGPLFVQYKGTQTNGSQYLTSESKAGNWDAKLRYPIACKNERSTTAECTVVTSGGTAYFTRTKNESAIELKSLDDPAELQLVLNDEARALATANRKGLPKLSDKDRELLLKPDFRNSISAAVGNIIQKTELTSDLTARLIKNGMFANQCEAEVKRTTAAHSTNVSDSVTVKKDLKLLAPAK